MHSRSVPPRESTGLTSREDELPAVGTYLRSRARTITEADLTLFSTLTADWHPQHSDAVWARDSLFGERIAHGLLVLSFASGLVEFDYEQVILLRRLHDVVFKRPTRIGDTISVVARVESVRPLHADNALLGLRWRVVNAHDETVLRARVDVLCRTASAQESRRVGSAEDGFISGVYPF